MLKASDVCFKFIHIAYNFAILQLPLDFRISPTIDDCHFPGKKKKFFHYLDRNKRRVMVEQILERVFSFSRSQRLQDQRLQEIVLE